MPLNNAPNPDTDPFRPPPISTLVGCLHCGQEYESYQIEWRVETDRDGRPHGFWCCPVAGCGGRGFGFDILPVDPNYQDERGGWVFDHEEEAGEDEWAPSERDGKRPADDDELPW